MRSEVFFQVRNKLVEVAHLLADVVELLRDDTVSPQQTKGKRGRSRYRPSAPVSEMDKMAAKKVAREKGWDG